jgi:ribonuclease E
VTPKKKKPVTRETELVKPRARTRVRRKPPGEIKAEAPAVQAAPATSIDAWDFSAGILEESRIQAAALSSAALRNEDRRQEAPRPPAVQSVSESANEAREEFQSSLMGSHQQSHVEVGAAPEADEMVESAPGGEEGSRPADGDDRGPRRSGRRRSRRGGRGRRSGGRENRQPQPDVESRNIEDAPDELDFDRPERAAPRTDDEAPADAIDIDDDEVESSREVASNEHREMLINVSDADECRISILREGRLDELYIERASSASNVGNIYKGRITNVEPSIQAAFVEFGKPVHGFLHISDLHPRYFPGSDGEPELVGRKTPRRNRPPIQNCLRRGQEVIVQVIKEGIGTKGPTLTTYISLPGRFLVMMPGMDELGVSRKIEDEELRRKLRDMLGQLSLPKDMGFIVRTAGVDRPKRDLQRDLNFLTRLWRKVEVRTKSEPAPAELYKESDLVIRTIRDVYDSSLRSIVVDNAAVAARVREFLAIASPRAQDIVKVYEDPEPMFHRYGIENEIEKLHSKYVPLACGGSLVIEQTEALVAIDVNSGRFRVPENAEETSYRVNLEAVDEIARQLRLRDLGGLIICDFIDMMQERHRRQIEKNLADALRRHKERAKILRISRFGILEMTRQRQRPSFAKSIFRECPRCGGSGRVKAVESVALDVMRQIRLASQREGVASIDVKLATAVANDILNRKRLQIADLERTTGQTIRISGEERLSVDDVLVSCTDRRGREVPIGMMPAGNVARPPQVVSAPMPHRPPIAPGADRQNGGRPPRSGGGRSRSRGRRRGGSRAGAAPRSGGPPRTDGPA